MRKWEYIGICIRGCADFGIDPIPMYEALTRAVENGDEMEEFGVPPFTGENVRKARDPECKKAP